MGTVTTSGVARGFRALAARLEEIQAALREQGLDGWLLYDLHARNAVAGRLLGLGDLTRRYFVFLPAEGEPQAVTHRIEQHPWADWPWRRVAYSGWRELDAALAAVVRGKRVAMEISERDAVPAMDIVPAGVLELVRSAGAEVVSSGDLVSRFYSRWSAEALVSHRRTAEALASVAADAFARAAAALRAGETLYEGELRRWVLEQLAARGFGVGADAIVAVGENAANPHYETGERGAPLERDRVLLLDLWSKERDDLVYADQTWMAYLGESVPDRIVTLWEAVRDARDAAVTFLRERWAAGQPVQGREVDDVARGVIAARGYGDAFVHRTGHSIDQATHGMGPNIDNLETSETRVLIPGVGFSIEPGIYLPGDVGLRSEINVYMGEEGPEVTPREPQVTIPALLAP
jgi:Xaa-Pro dipeptidase